MKGGTLSFLCGVALSAPAWAAPEVAPSERVRRNVVVLEQPIGDAPASTARILENSWNRWATFPAGSRSGFPTVEQAT